MFSNSMAIAHVILNYVNQKKIKGGCQSARKVVTQNSKSDLPLVRDLQSVGDRTLLFFFGFSRVFCSNLDSTREPSRV